jgi:hypothetical protein
MESLKKMVPTRWNSRCTMFRSISRNFKVIEELLVGTDHQHLIFTPQERRQIDQLLEFLIPFKTATDVLQGQRYSTISWIIPTIDVLKDKCSNDEYDGSDAHIDTMSSHGIEDSGVGNMGEPMVCSYILLYIKIREDGNYNPLYILGFLPSR